MPHYEEKVCKKHGLQRFVLTSCGYFRCTKCRSEAVQRRRLRVKQIATDFKGGKCKICGYNKCVDALEFHHRNPEEKEFGLGQHGFCYSIERIKKRNTKM